MSAPVYRLDEFGYPVTRRDLLNYLWHKHGFSVEILKQGRKQYVVLMDGLIYATNIRTLYGATAEFWADCIKKRYFPF